jgi:hypothetical protein
MAGSETKDSKDSDSNAGAKQPAKSEPLTVVAFFTGTGMGFNKKSRGYVSQKDMKLELPPRHDLLLMSVDEKISERVRADLLWRVSTAQNNAPILIKQGKKYSIYGNTDGNNWAVTELDSDKCTEVAKLFPTLGASKPSSIKYDDAKYKKLYDEIALKKGHTPQPLGFADLAEMLDEKQEFKGYDGCDSRVGGIFGSEGKLGGMFADGIEQPAYDQYARILELAKENKGKKINLKINADSRGCLTAYLLTMLINQNQDLKDKVDIILNLRDPVPGNLRGVSTMFRGKTASGKFFDLTQCTNVKAVYVTVHEKGFGLGFNVLVPQFSPATLVHVEALPGSHAIQFMSSYKHQPIVIREDSFDAHPAIYQLGLYKSLAIDAEHGFQMNYEKILEKLNSIHVHQKYYHEQLFNRGGELTALHKALQEFQETSIAKIKATYELLFPNNGPQPSSADSQQIFKKFINDQRLALYDFLLKDYKENPRPLHNRDLHYGGQYGPVCADRQQATHFNKEHFELSQSKPTQTQTVEEQKVDRSLTKSNGITEPLLAPAVKMVARDPKFLMGFKGERPDLIFADRPKKDKQDDLAYLPEKIKDTSLLTKPLVKEFLHELNQYCYKRFHHRGQENHYSFWGKMSGMSLNVKKQAVTDVIKAINGGTVSSDLNIGALSEGDLGATIRNHKNALPPELLNLINQESRSAHREMRMSFR